MYTLLAVGIKDADMQLLDWDQYGFDPHIRHTDRAHMGEAIRMAAPNAVFLDTDGTEDMESTLGEIHRGHQSCPCIVISREADHDHMRRAMRAGAFDYFTKPVTRDCLAEAARVLKERLAQGAIHAPIQEKRLADIAAYMEAHLHEKLTLSSVAGRFYISKNYLCYYFKRHTGVNFVDYLSSMRVRKAKALLASPISLDEIAERTGFSDTPYFVKVFKKYEGLSPGAYRRSIS